MKMFLGQLSLELPSNLEDIHILNYNFIDKPLKKLKNNLKKQISK